VSNVSPALTIPFVETGDRGGCNSGLVGFLVEFLAGSSHGQGGTWAAEGIGQMIAGARSETIKRDLPFIAKNWRLYAFQAAITAARQAG
jgi:hypothetical protein